MDGERFDRLTRGLLSGASRRSLLAGLFGGAAATVVGAGLLEARKGGKKSGRGRNKARSQGKGNGKGNGGNGGGGDDKQVEICHCPPGNPDNCHTIKIGKKAAEKHLENHEGDRPGPCDDDGEDRCRPITALQAGAERVGEDGLRLTTEGSDGFGAAAFGVPAGTEFSEIESISGSFDFETGSCGAGTPRYCVVFKEVDHCVCAQLPTELCDTETEGTFGDLAEPGMEWFRLCTATGPTINTYEDALAAFGDEEIDYIFVVADESNGEQTVTLETCVTLSNED